MWRSVSRALGYLLLALLVSLALLQGALRWALPFWLQDNPRLGDWLSQQLGQAVVYQRLQLDWQGFEPTLSLRGLQLAGRQVELDLLSLKLDILGSLWHRQWRSHRLQLQGLRLSVQQTANGWQLSGWTGGQSASTSMAELWQLLSAQQQIELEQVELQLQPLHGAVWPLQIPRLDWQRSADLQQLLGQALLLDGPEPTPLQLVIEQRADEPNIQFYLSTESLPLSRLNAWTDGWQMDGLASIKLWGHWPLAASQPELDLQLDLRQAQIRAEGQPDLAFAFAHARFNWNPDWAFPWQLSDVRVLDPKLSWPLQQARLGFSWQQGRFEGRLQSLSLDLESLAGWLALSPGGLPVQLQQGQLQQLDWQASSQAGQWQFDGQMDFEQVQLTIPGRLQLSGASGQLQGNQRQLQFDLQAKPLRLDTLGLFRQPLQFEQAQAQLVWQRKPDGWQLRSLQPVEFKQAEQQLQLQFVLEKTGQQPLWIDLLGQAQQLDAANTPLYLPTRIMAPQLVQFLDQSIKGGELQRAHILLRGPLAEFPFHQQQGSFNVEAELAKGRFVPPDWPEIRAIDAKLHFTGESMRILLQQADMAGVKIQAADLQIAEFRRPSLKVQAKSQSGIDSSLALLNQSPLQAVATSLKALGLKAGRFDTELEFELLLHDIELAQLKLSSRFRQLQLSQGGLLLDDIQGRLQLDRQQANLTGQATLAGERLDWSLQHSLKTGQQELNVRGRLVTAALARLWPSDWWSMARGELPFEAQLKLNADGKGRLTATSSLQGLALALPQPLAKAAADSSQLKLMADWPALSQIRLEYRNLQLVLDRQDGQLHGVRVALNQPLPVARAGLQIRAHWPQLDLVPWQDWLAALPADSSNSLPLTGLELSAERLQSELLPLTDFSLKLVQQTTAQRHFQLASRELAGQIRQPLIAQGIWQASFTHCYLDNDWQPSTAVFDPDAPPPALAADQDPRQIPSFDLQCQDFRWRRSQLGSLSLQARQKPQGIALQQIRLEGPRLKLDGHASWIQSAVGQLSLAALTLNSPDIGTLLDSVDIGTGIRDAKARLVADLNWSGGWHQLQAQRLNGQLSLQLGEGHLAEVSDKGARLFSLLSLETLGRRLRLDFSDIFQKGFFFNGLTGDFRFKQGKAYTDNMLLDGLAARVEIRGQADLVRREVDQQLLVIPKPGSSLPLLAAWAINPATGAAVFVLDKLFMPALNLITAIQYRAKGPWHDIELQEIGKQQLPLE